MIIAAAALYGVPVHIGGIHSPRRATRFSWSTVALWAALWWAPIAAARLSGARFLVEPGGGSRPAVVTFGRAHAVLAYMTQEIVADKGWLTTTQRVGGLGLAETTPGPLILVTEFVGFQAGAGFGGIGIGILAALMTHWVTFTPCFLWIFLGAPYVEHLKSLPRLSGALRALTAAVVGVIANLSLWFAFHVFFSETHGTLFGVLPRLSSVDLQVLAIAVICGGLC